MNIKILLRKRIIIKILFYEFIKVELEYFRKL